MYSFNDFKKRMKEIDYLIELIPPILPTSENVEQTNTLCRASIVLLSSHLEGFLQDLMEEFIDEVNQLEIGFKNLPVELYMQNCFPKGLITQNNFDALTKIFNEIKLLERKNIKMTLDKSKFAKTDGNPTSDVINRLFKILGIESVLDILNKEIKGLDTEESYKEFFTDKERKELNLAIGAPTIINEIEKYIVKKRNLKNIKKRNVGFYNTINQLLNFRNNIAHGNACISTSTQDLVLLKDEVFCLVESLSIKADERISALKGINSAILQTAVGLSV